MGFSLYPVIFNILMGFYKSKWLNEYNLNKPKLYFRYADEFNIDKQINHSIAFLDVFNSGIKKQNFLLQTYKPTYTGLKF